MFVTSVEVDPNGGGFALAYNARTATATRTELGAWFDKTFVLDKTAVLALRTRAAWAHDHTTDPSINATFQALPGTSFAVFGAAPVPNSMLASATAEIRLKSGLSFAGKFDGEIASRSQTYAGTGTARYVW